MVFGRVTSTLFLSGSLLLSGGLQAGEISHGQLFDEHYTMLYFTELGPADRFYGEVLGLERSYEDDWVHLYKATADSYIGAVKEGPGAFHKVQTENAVMVSLVTSDVNAVYAGIQEHQDVEIITPLHDSDSAPIRAFILRDPGGYTVEVFQWLKPGDSDG